MNMVACDLPRASGVASSIPSTYRWSRSFWTSRCCRRMREILVTDKMVVTAASKNCCGTSVLSAANKEGERVIIMLRFD